MSTYGRRVAVIGAGPSGLAAARHLKAHGFDPTIYEGCDRLGGQWDGGALPFRSVIHTDSEHPMDEDVAAYLDRYAESFGLTEALRLGTLVETVARHPAGGWVVHSVKRGETPRTELYPRVIVAAAFFCKPAQPAIAGIEGFAGSAGVMHSSDYEDAKPFEGKSVLVAGASIAALEIASDLASSGASQVFSTAPRQRCVLKKVGAQAGENVARTRFATIAGEFLPLEAVAAGMRGHAGRASGRAVEFGMLPLKDDLFDAWIALSERYLELVAAERITTKPQAESVEARTVRFADASSAEVDAIVFDAGFDLDLPFLDQKTRKQLGLENGTLDLPDATFHPQLEGLAFVGVFPQPGPYLPVVELQARWVADVWAGLAPTPSKTGTRTAANAAATHEPTRRREPRGDTSLAMALRFA